MKTFSDSLRHVFAMASKTQIIWCSSIILTMLRPAVLHHRCKSNNKKNDRPDTAPEACGAVITLSHSFFIIRCNNGYTAHRPGGRKAVRAERDLSQQQERQRQYSMIISAVYDKGSHLAALIVLHVIPEAFYLFNQIFLYH